MLMGFGYWAVCTLKIQRALLESTPPWTGSEPCAAPTCLSAFGCPYGFVASIFPSVQCQILDFFFPWHWHIHDFLWFIMSSQDFYMLFTLKLVSFQLACLSLLKGPACPPPRYSTSVMVEGKCMCVCVWRGECEGSVWYSFKWLFKKKNLLGPCFVSPPVFLPLLLQPACWAFSARVHLSLPVTVNWF